MSLEQQPDDEQLKQLVAGISEASVDPTHALSELVDHGGLTPHGVARAAEVLNDGAVEEIPVPVVRIGVLRAARRQFRERQLTQQVTALLRGRDSQPPKSS
jgi:phenylpyruvate tautomerase PptA (4-oxalocrotonate tautomerase family)